MRPKQLENIIRFLDNDMTPSEKAAFEQLIQDDVTLAKEVTFQRGLHGFLGRRNPTLPKLEPEIPNIIQQEEIPIQEEQDIYCKIQGRINCK